MNLWSIPFLAALCAVLVAGSCAVVADRRERTAGRLRLLVIGLGRILRPLPDAARCPAEWRRPTGHRERMVTWRCVRFREHVGRHAMRRVRS